MRPASSASGTSARASRAGRRARGLTSFTSESLSLPTALCIASLCSVQACARPTSEDHSHWRRWRRSLACWSRRPDAAARISTPSATERDVDTLRGRSNEHPHASDVLLPSVVCRPKVQQSDCAKGCKHDDDNRHGCARMGELRRPPEGPAEFAVYHSAYARLYYRVARWLEGR